MYICKCNRKFERKRQLSAHKAHCGKKRDYSKCGWSKGLTKDTDSRLFNYSKTLKEYYKTHIPSSLNRHHTKKTKQLLSKIRTDYITNHPDKVPYLLNHSSKRSYPELLFEKALKNANISGWISAYRNGIYEYDFAFPELKLDIEIDGSTHKTQKVINIDKRRDKWSKEEGWTVIRFEAQDVKKNVDECIERLRRLL